MKPVLSKTEMKDTRLPRIEGEVLHELFERQADARPTAVAVVDGSKELTYARLEAGANRLARHLRRHGVGRGSVVAMLLPRSIDAYAALLGIMKAGAAYVPIDPEYPAARIAYILENSGAAALVTTTELAERCTPFRGTIVRVDTDRGAIAAESAARLRRDEVGVGPRDVAYIIYTSGSTGRPKGVMVEHRNVCHLVRAEAGVYGVCTDDRVYQGASLAFDLSVEEIWIAFHAGATLVAATPELARAGPDLSRLLTERGVTVLSCVPTLLSMLDAGVPTLRLLILGGEACSDTLVARWMRPGLRIVNTYGPTETTVIATYVELQPGKPVTIGRPVPGYHVYLLDERLQPVPRGAVGEICIGGEGVARGYVGLPEETRARFVPDPFVRGATADARMYRSGDVGRLDAEGNIEFVGRLDGQVKLRGFRVELSEIEAVLGEVDGVMAAACAVREDVPGVQQLVGYVVRRDGVALAEAQLSAHVRSRLPACMTPGVIETVSELPRLPSGKLDRSALPAPRARPASTEEGRAGRPRTDAERRIAEVWESLFRPQTVSVNDDFFRDLGGHSLLAARMVSELRKDARFRTLAMLDVYRHPTIASLAATFESVSPHRHESDTEAAAAPSVSPTDERRARRRHALTGVIQAASVWFALGVKGLPWVTPYLVLFLLLESGYSVLYSTGWAALTAMAVFPAMVMIAIATKWLVLGRVRAGRYPLWGAYYLRWWFVHTVTDAARLVTLSGTPFLPFVYRLLGARIGRNVYMSTDRIAAMDLISIGDGSSVDERAALLGYTVEDGQLVIGPISIGRDCFVGSRAVLREYTVLEDGARLEDLTMIPTGTRVPHGETWAGSPARRTPRHDPPPAPRPQHGPLRRAGGVVLYAALLLLLSIVELVAFFPGILVLTRLDFFSFGFFLALPFVGAAFVVMLAVQVVLFKWALVGRVRAGTYPVHGSFYIRNWLVDRLLELSLGVMAQIRATLYVAPWYRALGAKIGRMVELSTASSSTPDLLELADGSTIADEVSLGSPRIEAGWMTVAPTRLGRRAFIGNSAVVPVGTTLGDGSLLGVLSIAPADLKAAARSGASWLGSPPILLPRRQASDTFSEERTYHPRRRLRLARGAFELLRVTLPPAGLIFVTAAVVTAAIHLWEYFALGIVLLFLPFVYTAACAVVLAAVALIKWTVIGRYRPFVRPLWSNFVWRLELVNALYEFLAAPLALESLQGTPLLPWYLRRLGARIGRRAYIETTGFLEWDLVQIGDRVALNEDCVMQTHLFEDRVLKASWLRIGDDCVIGDDSVVLYDTEMKDGSRLHAVSLLMKGETLPAGTAWAGSPLAICRSVGTRRGEHEQPGGTAA